MAATIVSIRLRAPLDKDQAQLRSVNRGHAQAGRSHRGGIADELDALHSPHT